MLLSLNSIQEINTIYETGDRPALVLCNDIQDWICKYGSSVKLINEYLGSSFANCWGLKTPDISQINVQEEHLPIHHLNILQPAYFKTPCFGSLRLENCKEIDESILVLLKNKADRNKIRDKSEYLKIALFDIWLSNEDRHYNNSNLFLEFSNSSSYEFYVFDHGAIFNTGSLHRGVYQINENDSLIKTPLAKLLFTNGRKLTEIVNNLVENFYLCIEECEDNLSKIINEIPKDWNAPAGLENTLREQIFSDSWIRECELSFRTFIQSNL